MGCAQLPIVFSKPISQTMCAQNAIMPPLESTFFVARLDNDPNLWDSFMKDHGAGGTIIDTVFTYRGLLSAETYRTFVDFKVSTPKGELVALPPSFSGFDRS